MNLQRTLNGVFPVFQTPYHHDGSIDFDTLEKEIHWLYDKGAQGIVMALASEILRLSSEEREQLAGKACRYGRKRGVVVISVGAESGHTAECYARHAESVGADALMAVPPISTALGEQELLAYYKRIIKAVKVPVIVQDASGFVGCPMSITLQAKILEEFGDQVLFKPEAKPIGPKLSELRDATAGKAKIFEGTGGIALVDSYHRGIIGTMPGADLIEGIVALWHALEDKDEPLVTEISLPIVALISMLNSLDAFLAVEKYLLVKQGVFKNTIVRGPVDYTLDPETQKEVDRLFDLILQTIKSNCSN